MTTLALTFCAVVLHQFVAANSEFYECGVSSKYQKIVVDEHNKFRLQIAKGLVKNQPRGVNLKKMHWDNNLATAAQELAETGVFEHFIKPDRRFPVGQNLYTSMSTVKTSNIEWPEAVKEWFIEHEDYDYATGAHTGVVGHYTQVVWADTDHVGCGYCSFKNRTDQFAYKKLYVCNYGPAGNYVGQKPYKTGTSGCENLC